MMLRESGKPWNEPTTNRLETRIAELETALDAACAVHHGQAYFVTGLGLMEMPTKSEVIVRKALKRKDCWRSY